MGYFLLQLLVKLVVSDDSTQKTFITTKFWIRKCEISAKRFPHNNWFNLIFWLSSIRLQFSYVRNNDDKEFEKRFHRERAWVREWIIITLPFFCFALPLSKNLHSMENFYVCFLNLLDGRLYRFLKSRTIRDISLWLLQWESHYNVKMGHPRPLWFIFFLFLTILR